MLLLIRAVYVDIVLCKFFEDQNARENENEMKIFALFTKTTKNSIKMYKKLERNTISQFLI